MDELGMVEMTFERVAVNLEKYKYALVLKEENSANYLSCLMDNSEGMAFFDMLKNFDNIQLSQVRTLNLLTDIMNTTGLKADSCEVEDFRDNCFYTLLILSSIDGSQRYEIDCRLSDAIAICIRTSAPIFADTEVVQKEGVIIDEEGKYHQIKELAREIHGTQCPGCKGDNRIYLIALNRKLCGKCGRVWS